MGPSLSARKSRAQDLNQEPGAPYFEDLRQIGAGNFSFT